MINTIPAITHGFLMKLTLLGLQVMGQGFLVRRRGVLHLF